MTNYEAAFGVKFEFISDAKTSVTVQPTAPAEPPLKPFAVATEEPIFMDEMFITPAAFERMLRLIS